MPPLLPAALRLARLLSQQTLWALSVVAIAISSVLLGYAVAMNIKSPVARAPGCDNKNDPAFWQGLGQIRTYIPSSPFPRYNMLCL
ncbi:hypothetical protein F5X96DRAFT_646163 [Biscogniauxia mediterranea]|nr:hypothetical protein F5X96DRAFT_646163 [Biscogniauxia mediterranea]